MPWKTSTGKTLEFPHAIFAKAARGEKLSKDEMIGILDEVQKIHQAALDMDNLIITLRRDNMRLQHENEFMIRLVNERDTT